MKITHRCLLELGFIPLPDRPHLYIYKAVTGRLEEEVGNFHIERFKVPISAISDLTYMLEVVDYYHK